MSGTKLALIVVVPFLLLAAAGYRMTQLEAPPASPDFARAERSRSLDGGKTDHPELLQRELREEPTGAAIKAVSPLVRQCFEDVAKRYPGLQTVKLTFTLQGQGLTGTLQDGEVAASSIPDPFLETCFLEAMADAKFPLPHGGGPVKITYPFTYRAGEDIR